MNKNKIKSYRMLTGLNQNEMAKELGISKQAYFQKENGQTEFTRSEMFKFYELVSKLNETVTLIDIFG